MMKVPANEKAKIKRSIFRTLTETHGKKAYVVAFVGKGKSFTYPTGLKGWQSVIKITAPGFKTAYFRLFYDASGYWHLHIINKSFRDVRIASTINMVN